MVPDCGADAAALDPRSDWMPESSMHSAAAGDPQSPNGLAAT
jgi:hypothetical protein